VAFALGVVVATWPLVLHPATLWPPHHDPRLFTWVMASQARKLLTDPLNLFQGDTLYPYGESHAFTDVLMVPSLLGLPGFVWGNPILTYNLLLLGLWPLNGVTMAWAAYRLTGSRWGAGVAGAVLCLSPYFTEYHVEFQMLPAAPMPVVLLAWVRWLETGRRGWLALAAAGLAVQGLTTWYYTIMLGLALVTVTLGVAALRWRGWGWRRRLPDLAVAVAGVAAVLLPFALPYFAIYREMGLERGIPDTSAHYADLFTFIEPGWRSLVYRFQPAHHVAETSAFPGFVVLALAALSVSWCRWSPRPAGRLAGPARAARLALAAALVAAVGLCLLGAPRGQLGRLVLHLKPAEFMDLAVVCALGLLLVHGAETWRQRAERALAWGDWVRLLWLVVLVSVILALGPVIHVAEVEVGRGPYLALYRVLFPLHAIRITVRFAILTMTALGLLAALGVAVLEARLRGWPRRLVPAAVLLAVLVEYAVTPAEYAPVAWAARPVDGPLAADPADVAVLEFPTNTVDADAEAMLRSLIHGKRVVNGVSGFIPPLIRELSGALTTPGPVFPTEVAEAALARVYPLRYLVVRPGHPDLPPEWVPAWEAVRGAPPPFLRYLGRYGADDLYRFTPRPARANRLERWVSYDFIRRHPRLHLDLAPRLDPAGREEWVEVRLNDRRVARVPMGTATVRLAPPFRRAAPNVITLEYGHRRGGWGRDPAYAIGRTGVLAPGDLRVVSASDRLGSARSIRVNAVERSPEGPGYNVVALDRSGQVLSAEAFDTSGDAVRAARDGRGLAAWVAALPPGTVVAGAVWAEGPGQPTEDTQHALRSLGVAGDLRGHPGLAHAFVGVKGAPAGTALEALGDRRIELVVGRFQPNLGFELRGFALDAPATRE
jgi:hypothetical protein